MALADVLLTGIKMNKNVRSFCLVIFLIIMLAGILRLHLRDEQLGKDVDLQHCK